MKWISVWEYLYKNEYIPIWNEFILTWNKFIPYWNEFILGLNNFFENSESKFVAKTLIIKILFVPKRIFHIMLFWASPGLFWEKTSHDLEWIHSRLELIHSRLEWIHSRLRKKAYKILYRWSDEFPNATVA